MKLLDVCSGIVDCPHSTAKDEGHGFPLIRTPNVGKGRLKLEDVHRVSLEVYNKRNERAIPQENDLILAREAPVGNVAIIRSGQKVCLGQRTVLIRPNPQYVDPDYLVYYLLSPSIQHKLISASNGATVSHLNMSSIRDLEIQLPDIERQKKIGKILSKLDDKIDLNNKINKNIEEQALSLFQDYFIDFTPYNGTAPASWKKVTLGEVCLKVTDGSHYSPADAPGSRYPMFSVKDMRTYGFDASSCKHITEEEFQKMKQNDCVPLINDILVAKDGSYLKEIFICNEEKDEAILSSIAIFRPNSYVILPIILLYLLKQPSVRKDVGDNYVSGSALPRIVLKDFKKYQFILPSMEEQKKVGVILQAMNMQIKENVEENDRLSAMRDALLPKLISGELLIS